MFGEANGVTTESELLVRLESLARRPVTHTDAIGCVAVNGCVFFEEDSWLEVPSSFKPQNLSGSVIDLGRDDGKRLWAGCLERASMASGAPSWIPEAIEGQKYGRPYVVKPRLGQGSFKLAVMEAYGGGCAVTGEHSMPALEAAHIRPYSAGGAHDVVNGLPLRRDVHRLFDLGYVSASAAGTFLVSPRLREEFENGHTYYALEGRGLRRPERPNAMPDRSLLAWHSETVFRAT